MNVNIRHQTLSMYDVEIPQLLLFSTNKTVDIVEFLKRNNRFRLHFVTDL